MKSKIARKQTIALAISVALAGGSFNAMADDDAIMAELMALKQKIEQLERDLVASQEVSKKADEQISRDLVDSQEAAKTSDRVLFEGDSPSPTFVSSDGSKTMEIHGRAFIDFASMPDMYTYGKVGDMVESKTSTEFRKLYLGVEGNFAPNWEYELTIDFAEQAVDLKDANVAYTGWANDELIMGFQKPAFGLEQTSSSRYTMFMSRASTDNFSTDRALGVSWAHVPSWGSIKLGAFVPNSFIDGKLKDHTEGETEDGVELIPSEASNEVESYILTGRTTWAPIASDNRLVHLGASGLYVGYDEPSTAKIKGRPSTHLAEKLVYAKVKDADSQALLMAEGAFMYDNFYLQTEYVNVRVDAEEDYSFDGYYLSASWTLTGESRIYKKASGKFKGINPAHPLSMGGWGAWEVAARYSNINLNDGDVEGGNLTSMTLGLNWYMENNLRAMLNYVHYEADDYKDSSKYVISQDGNVIQGRLAFYF